MRRVAVLWNPANPSHPLAIEIATSRPVRWECTFSSSRPESEQLRQCICCDVLKTRGALLILIDPFFVSTERGSPLAGESRLPAIYGSRVNGGRWSDELRGRLNDIFPSLGEYVDKILKGASPRICP